MTEDQRLYLDESQVFCPSCGEPQTLVIDSAAAIEESIAEYTEDCSVCCRPMVVTVTYVNDGDYIVQARSENE
ncbi:MAG: CPXCG motif-containing cysteine-rich protein [Amphritea sp.]|nr:CPXCG motif-containing cysteine-rich protein [Amphritea sp.]